MPEPPSPEDDIETAELDGRTVQAEMFFSAQARKKQCEDCGCDFIVGTKGRNLTRCTKCRNHRNYLANKTEVLARQKQRYIDNRAEIRRKNSMRDLAALTKRPMIYAFYGARRRARQQGIPFKLKYKDLPPPPQFCPVLGVPIKYGRGPRTDNSPSLDKIIPKLGYVRGNVQIISFRANRFKSDASLEELERLVAHLRSIIKPDYA